MAKKNSRRELRWSIDDKRANKQIEAMNTAMTNIKNYIGTSGDFANGGKETLIGCVESLNNEARDGAVLTAAYDRFNSVTLDKLQKNLSTIESKLLTLDMIAK